MLLTLTFTIGTLSWYISVSKIPLGEITAIYNTSCFFTYLLAIVFLKERFEWVKIIAVTISILGILIIALVDSQVVTLQSEMFVGYSSAVISSLGVAVYEVLYAKTVVPQTPSVLFSLFVTGCIGICTIPLGVVFFPILHYSGYEIFGLPTLEQFGYLLLNAIIGVIFNALFFLVIAFESPVFAAVGILLSIPITSLVDRIVMGTQFGWNLIAGSVLITIGFLILQNQLPRRFYDGDSETDGFISLRDTDSFISQ
jgi:drug/metabolite transporter (DMT)-like permease